MIASKHQPHVHATVIGLIVVFGMMSLNIRPTLATGPTPPIDIITPEDLARSGKFTTDMVEVVVRKNEIVGFKTQLILFRNGKRVDQMAVDLQPKPMTDPLGANQGLAVAEIAAVPEEFWKRVKPGVYAHKIRIEANLKGSDGSLLVQEWVRWRTDGKRVELLTIDRYSALVEKTEITTDADGKQVLMLVGDGIKLEAPSDPSMEKLDTRIGGDGVRMEQSVKPNKEELKRFLDESQED